MNVCFLCGIDSNTRKLIENFKMHKGYCDRCRSFGLVTHISQYEPIDPTTIKNGFLHYADIFPDQ